MLVFNGIYQLPIGSGSRWLNTGSIANAILGGWQVGGILTWQTGTPFIVSCGSCSFTGYTISADRPNLKPGADLSTLMKGIPPNVKGRGASAQFFDPGDAFTLPPPGTLGNSPRSTLVGPAFKNVNFTLAKSFNVVERMRLQFRSEFFNFLNHTLWCDVEPLRTGPLLWRLGRI